jgi:PAS domain S-box-containing protein
MIPPIPDGAVTAVTAHGQATLVMDEHGRIVRWGSDAAALFGWSEDEVRGRTVADTIVPSFYREAHRRGVAAHVAGRRPVLTGRFIAVTALRRDGSEFETELVITAVTTPEGRMQFTAVLRDMSGIDVSRRLRRLELDVSRSLMQPTISDGLERALAVAAVGLGCDVAQLWLSDAASPVLTPRYRWDCGSARVAEFVALRADDLLPPREALAAVWQGGLPFLVDTGMDHTEALLSGASTAGLSCMVVFPLPAMERHSGALILLAPTCRPVDEELLAVMGSITSQMGQALARDQAERCLRQDRFRALLEAAPDAILGVGAGECRISLVNVAAERLFGYAREELLGQSIEVLISEASRATHPDLCHGYFTARPRTGGERLALATRRKDGTEFPAEMSFGALEGDEGMLVLVSVRDVTERVQAQEAMQRAIVAELATEAKTAFMSRVSHELRTPLNAILGFAQLMTMADLPEQQRGYARIIHRAGSHLDALIRDVLDFSCIEAGNLPLWMEPVSIETVVHEAVELVGPMAAEHCISTTVDPAAGQAHVLADPQRLRQVLVNLLANAVKYNRPGGRVRLILQEGNGRTRLGIVDTGSGISSQDLPRLFQPFDRLDAERSGIEGTGLGLALSQHLVTAMGGSLTVDSRPGDGSTFWVDLTSASAPAGPAEDVATDLPPRLGLRGRTPVPLRDREV